MQLVRGAAARPVNQLASFVFDELIALCPVTYPRVTVGDMVFLFERQKHHAPPFSRLNSTTHTHGFKSHDPSPLIDSHRLQ